MVLDKAKTEKGLRKKGFVNAKDKSVDHIYLSYEVDGVSLCHTKLSRGNSSKDLSNDLIKYMAQQCRLSKKDFLDLVNCPLSQAEYEKKLKAQTM